MLFKNLWRRYKSTLTVQNIYGINHAKITIDFEDVATLSCVGTDNIPAKDMLNYWLPDLSCLPKVEGLAGIVYPVPGEGRCGIGN
jgi:hypothetical protein